MNTPKISVIVPVYNVEQYLPRCIDSILAQTFTDFELLLIDDGSPDNSGKICDEYAERDTRIRVFHKKNGGVSSARNMGLENAQGEWIAFVDGDDWVENSMFYEMYSHALINKVDIVISDFYINDRCKQIIDYQYNEYVPYLFFKAILEGKAMGSLWNKLFHYKLFENIKFDIEITYCEDVLVLAQILYKSNIIISFIHTPFYHYFKTPKSLTSIVTRTSFKMRLLFFEKLEKILNTQNCDFVGVITIRKMKILISMVKSLLYNNRELNIVYIMINDTISKIGDYKKDYNKLRYKYIMWKFICTYPILFKTLKSLKKIFRSII